MNNLLFICLTIALLYYFFYYLPQQKQLTNPDSTNLTHSTFTQTEPTLTNSTELEELKKDISQKEQTIIGLNNSYDKLEQKTAQQIKELQTQIRDLAKRPLKPTNSKSTQTDELTNTLDTLIRDIQELNNSLN
jgi:DNA repair exonuclease SbcCD ATPase subunit